MEAVDAIVRMITHALWGLSTGERIALIVMMAAGAPIMAALIAALVRDLVAPSS